MKIYLASPLSENDYARTWRDTLVESGFLVVSTWHDLVTEHDARDPSDSDERASTLLRNLHELRSADVLLALMRSGIPRATNGEIGFAVALHKPVVWLAGPTSLNDNIFTAHALVQHTRSGSNALHLLMQMARGGGGPGLAKAGTLGGR